MECPTTNKKPTGGLVFLKSGKYFKVSPLPPDDKNKFFEIEEQAQGILLEHQGILRDANCWHVLVDGTVILVWDDNIIQKSSKGMNT
jgi:hypothetical protein